MKKNLLKLILAMSLLVTHTSCDTKSAQTTANATDEKNVELKVTKKYTNADFYKDGEIQPEVALKAYEEFLAGYGITLSPFMRENLWITDFEQGDFENVGMAGFFWVNDAEHNYFAHEIYLLPGQMIAEHRHLPTKFAPKMESWVVKEGMIYNYKVSDVVSPNQPTIPAKQKENLKSTEFAIQKPGEIMHLNKIGDFHFMMAGDKGAVVYEFASYHDGAGLNFSNPTVEFTDMLTKNN